MFGSLLKRSNPSSSYITPGGGDIFTETKNWYSDRISALIAQRNILFLFNTLLLLVLLLGVFVIKEVTSSKTVEPFVIQVEDTTGITKVVNPMTRTTLAADEQLHRYFLFKYIQARETYNPVDYLYNYTNVVRLLSSPEVFSQFRRYINDETKSPIKLYGSFITTSVKIRAIQILEAGKVATIRFVVKEEGKSNRTFNRIATIEFGYVPMELTQEERFVNPIGFQVTKYRIDDEIFYDDVPKKNP